MYALQSDLSRKEYLSKLKQTFRNPFLLFDEHVSGIIIGPFFSVAYHSPYEWNRRITSECNRAWGYVKDVDGKAYVRFIRGKGMLSPFWILFYATVVYLLLFLQFGHETEFLIAGIGISLCACIVTAFQSVVTEAGEAGFHEVTRLLLHPEDYYG